MKAENCGVKPAHAECFEELKYIDMSKLCLDKVKGNYINHELQNPVSSILNTYKAADIAAITDGKQMSTNYAVSIKKYGEILYVNSQYKYKYLIDDSALIIDNDGLYFKTIYEGTAVVEPIDIGKMHSFELLDSSNFASIEKLEVK